MEIKKMRKILCNTAVFLLTVGLFYFPSAATPTASAQGAQDFLLVNKTGVEINALYITPHNSKDWGEDILGVDTLLDGKNVEINFSPRETAKLWDLRIEDEDGNYLEWDSLNLLKISTVTLYYKNGKTTAILD